MAIFLARRSTASPAIQPTVIDSSGRLWLIDRDSLTPSNDGAIARRLGGSAIAADSCVTPTYEPPSMPTFPSHHGCAATHSIVS